MSVNKAAFEQALWAETHARSDLVAMASQIPRQAFLFPTLSEVIESKTLYTTPSREMV